MAAELVDLVHVHTPGDAPAGAPTLVCIHGLGGTKEFWGPIVPRLASAGDVVTLDLPGFGKSPEPGGAWTLEGAAAAVHRLIAELELERVVLIGHSLGGGVAVTAALQDPSRIAALTLVSPAGYAGQQLDDPTGRAHALHAAWRIAARPLIVPMLRLAPMRRLFFASLVHDPAALDYRSMVGLASGSMRGRSTVPARAAIMRADLLPRLHELRMPVHLIWGTGDRVTPSAMAERLLERLDDAHLTMLDDVGHLPVWEQPEQVAHAVLSRLP